MQQLQDYLRTSARQPFSWGVHDCALFVADWVALFSASDPAARWRGRYADETTARALAGFLGFPGLIAEGARRAGLPRARDPAAGDIGVVVIGNAVGAIRTPGGWAARLPRGLIVARSPRILASWSVPCRKR